MKLGLGLMAAEERHSSDYTPHTSYLYLLLIGLTRLPKPDRNHSVDIKEICSVILFIQIYHVLVSNYT